MSQKRMLGEFNLFYTVSVRELELVSYLAMFTDKNDLHIENELLLCFNDCYLCELPWC